MTVPGDGDLAREYDDVLSMHAAVRADAARFRALFDAAPVALVSTDLNLRVTEANRAAAELLDVREPFLLGKPLTVYVDLESRRVLRRAVLRREPVTTLTLRMRRRTGVAFEAAVKVTAGPEELYLSILDRTENAQAEARLWELNRELEGRAAQQVVELQTVVANLPVGVAVVTRSGEVGWSNERIREILGEAPDRLAGFVTLDEEGNERPLTRLPSSRAAAGETLVAERMHVLRRDGTAVAVDVSASAIPSEHGGAVVVVQDVTARDRVERADADFVENAAHQLRTPITAIGSSVGALLAGASADPTEQARFLAHIARETERMAKTVDALLTLAGLQRGVARPLVELVPLRPLVEDALAALPATGCSVRVEIGDEIALVGDRELFAQSIGNVIDNAAEHARSEVRVAAALAGATVTLEVADDGPGVPPDARDRVFDRFFRATSSRKGSGLGLAIARAAAQATRSSLELLETAGPGATFRFKLPGARLL